MERAAKIIYQRLHTGRFSFLLNDRVQEDLLRLYPGEAIGERLENFYVKKIKQFLLVLSAGLLLGIAAFCSAGKGKYLMNGNSLDRADYLEGKREVRLQPSLLEGQTIDLTLYPTEPSEEEKETVTEEFLENMEQYILGKNEDFGRVYRDLMLQRAYDGIPFETEWESSRPDLMDEWGTVGVVKEDTSCVLTVTIRWGEYSRCAQIPITVIPVPKTDREEQAEALENYLLNREQETRKEECFQLPMQWEGQAMSWKQQTEDYSLLIWALTPAIAVLLFLAADRDLHSELLNRQDALRAAYPGLVHRILLYLGAGLSLRSTFEQLAKEYDDETGNHPAGQEIRLLVRQLKAGIPENTVYEHFGRRLGVREYMRLSALLIQNRRRGNAALLERLRQEAAALSEEKLLQARKLGEEAGTKLLFPMVMLLGCVMVMIMIPAFGVM